MICVIPGGISTAGGSKFGRMFRLVPLSIDRALVAPYLQNDFCRSVIEAWETYYPKVGYQPPWIGYWLTDEAGRVVAVGGYKGPPKGNQIELSYGTVPEYQGKGFGTIVCRELVRLALATDPHIIVTARTLPAANASCRILEKNGFFMRGTVTDPEDGEVWEWVLKRPTTVAPAQSG